MRKHATSSDGTRIAYDVLGDGPRTIVLVHGWMASSTVFDDLLAVWQPSGFRILKPDLRGAGDSEPARDGYTLARYRDDVLAVIDAERVDRAVVIGHSMGGQLSQLIAASSPERVAGLVCIVPVPASGLPLPADAGGFFRSAGGNAEALGRILDMASPGIDRAVHARLTSEAMRVQPRCVAEAFDAWSAGGFEAQLSAVRSPALIIASDDPFLPVPLLDERVASKIGSARLAKIDGAGHYPLNEQPRAIGALLEAFLAGLGDGSRG
jgi:pimeloyl-ACP methyl ester carboxylesterase